MPRINYLAAAEQKAIADEIVSMAGGATLTIADVGRYLGIENQASLKKWLSDVKGAMVNGRPRYYASDIARKLYEDRIIGGELNG